MEDERRLNEWKSPIASLSHCSKIKLEWILQKKKNHDLLIIIQRMGSTGSQGSRVLLLALNKMNWYIEWLWMSHMISVTIYQSGKYNVSRDYFTGFIWLITQRTLRSFKERWCDKFTKKKKSQKIKAELSSFPAVCWMFQFIVYLHSSVFAIGLWNIIMI